MTGEIIRTFPITPLGCIFSFRLLSKWYPATIRRQWILLIVPLIFKHSLILSNNCYSPKTLIITLLIIFSSKSSCVLFFPSNILCVEILRSKIKILLPIEYIFCICLTIFFVSWKLRIPKCLTQRGTKCLLNIYVYKIWTTKTTLVIITNSKELSVKNITSLYNGILRILNNIYVPFWNVIAIGMCSNVSWQTALDSFNKLSRYNFVTFNVS